VWWPHVYREGTCVCDVLAHIAPVYSDITLYAINGSALRWYDQIRSDVFGVSRGTIIVNVRGQIVSVRSDAYSIQDIISACSLVDWVLDAKVVAMETIDSLSGLRVRLDPAGEYTGCVLYAVWEDTGILLDEAIYSCLPIAQIKLIHLSDIEYIVFACGKQGRPNKTKPIGTVCIMFQQDEPFYSIPIPAGETHGGLKFQFKNAVLHDGRTIRCSTRSLKLYFPMSLVEGISIKLDFNTPLQYKSCTYSVYVI